MGEKSVPISEGLKECARALLEVTVNDDSSLIESLIDQGYTYLHELKSAPNPDQRLVFGLSQRIKAAEQALKHKRRIEALV